MQAQLVGSIWFNVVQQYPQHDHGEKNSVSAEYENWEGMAWNIQSGVFLKFGCVTSLDRLKQDDLISIVIFT